MTNRLPIDARARTRQTLHIKAKVKRVGETLRRVLVRNLSEDGMMIEGNDSFAVGDRVIADLPGYGKVEGTIAWTELDRAGMAFSAPIDPALVEPALRPVR